MHPKNSEAMLTILQHLAQRLKVKGLFLIVLDDKASREGAVSCLRCDDSERRTVYARLAQMLKDVLEQVDGSAESPDEFLPAVAPSELDDVMHALVAARTKSGQPS